LGFLAGRSRNRRPVDFAAARARLLETLEEPDWDRLVRGMAERPFEAGLTRQLLKLRTGLAAVFTDGDYAPLEVTGQHRDHFIAFARAARPRGCNRRGSAMLR
jgi:(1->4)-alpha-D-glucan 1-alpha-D-glucosylmutase